MSLELLATPIGNDGDITLRAIEVLRAADVVIGEERREVSTLLKRLGIEGKRLELLNEHSREEDLRELVQLCRTSRVALVTDCGTPGFCDPGANLVALCRAEGISSKPVPGASSLMCLLSVSGKYLNEFLFRGFLPAEKEARATALTELVAEKRPVILMDTPYRMIRLLEELAERFPARRVLLGCDFTQSTETVIDAAASELPKLIGERKAEFILALFPGESAIQPTFVKQNQETNQRNRRPAPSGGGRKFTPGRRR